MIVGIGTDLCDVARVEKSLQKDTFLRGIYSAAEQELILSNVGKSRAETAAANFAAKEAFLKACGMGLGGFPLAEISVLRKESGAPYYALEGTAARWIEGTSADNAPLPHPRKWIGLCLCHSGTAGRGRTLMATAVLQRPETVPKTHTRQSGLELLRILCMLFIIADHYAGQSGAALYDTLPHALFFALLGAGSPHGMQHFRHGGGPGFSAHSPSRRGGYSTCGSVSGCTLFR